MGVQILSSSGGGVTINSTVTASNYTQTLPAETGTVITTASTFAGTGPAFNAYMSANQTVTTGVSTKVILNIETFDTNSNFDSTTNYRFTPTVAGYYQFNGTIYGQATTNMTATYIQINKNGTLYQYGAIQNLTASTSPQGITVNSLVYLNGSTDYVELFGTIIGTGTCSFTHASGSVVYFSGFLARSA